MNNIKGKPIIIFMIFTFLLISLSMNHNVYAGVSSNEEPFRLVFDENGVADVLITDDGQIIQVNTDESDEIQLDRMGIQASNTPVGILRSKIT